MYQQNQYPELIPEAQIPETPDPYFPAPNEHPKSSPYSKSLFLSSVQVIKTPPGQIFPNKISESSAKSQTEASVASYWRHNFIIAFLPFIFWGAPVHLLFGRRRISSTREWFKSLCPCSFPLVSIFSVITAILTVILNGYTIYVICHLFVILVIQADVSNSLLLPYIITVIRLLPVVIPLDLIWFKGHVLRRIIASFDLVTDNYRKSPMSGEALPKIPSCRLKLALLYVIILCIHVLHVFTVEPDAGTKAMSDMTWHEVIVTVVIDHSLAVLMTLLFPLYCTFCWAIQYELLMLKGYIKSLIRARASPQHGHFDEFKKSYRQLADHIMNVNQMFSIYLSFIALDLGSFLWSDLEKLGSEILVMFLNGGGLQSMFENILGQKSPDLVVTQPTDVTMPPEKVRLVLGNILTLLLYLALFGLTYWQAVKVNDEVRYLHVWLNDFVSEPEVRVTADLYEAFQLLKFYIHSRLEQQRPALLSIAAISLVPVPGLYNRLMLYKVTK